MAIAADRSCSTSCWRAQFLVADFDDETFLEACAPEVRKRHGVYFTPPALVGAQVRLVDDVLRRRLGCSHGLANERLLIVDPACGGGAYPRSILSMVGARYSEVRARMWLWESLPEAAALSRARGLPVREQDALEATPAFDAPIVVCVGNPPYRRRAKAAPLDGFTDGAKGVHLKNLYNEYVYFWRWTLRTVVEQRSGAALVCLLTAASYVRGPAFAGMRRSLRQAFDDLWVIDLEGDSRAARASRNVFPIRTPVAIALGVRYGASSLSTAASVRYARMAGSAADKLSTLDAVRSVDDFEWHAAGRQWTSPLLPMRRDAYSGWPALADLFPWQTSGVQLKRTWPIGVTRAVLRTRWRRLLETPASNRDEMFGATRDRDVTSTPPDLGDGRRLPPLEQLPEDAPCPEPREYAYRPFDRRWILADPRLGDFLRAALWRAHGPRQVYLTTMLTNVLGPGPAAIATASVPDLDQFRGSFGARGVIPLWRDPFATEANVSTAWLRRLGEVYGHEISAADLMAYCYALLAGRGYTRRFDEDLRTPGPRVPLTLDASLFRTAVALGQTLLAVHTYRQVEAGCCHVVRSVGGEYPSRFAYANESLLIGDGEVGPVPREVWAYSVSGYRVLPSWVRRRVQPTLRGRSALDRVGPAVWTEGLTRELVELIWLLEKTLAIEPDLQALLEAVVSGNCLQHAVEYAVC